MRTIIAISDTHGHSEGIDDLRPLMRESDYIVHLGDGAGDMREILRGYPEKTYVCRGNCDFYAASDEGIVEADGVKIFFCHGHKYRVKSDLSLLAAEAKRRGCRAALYGHTHRALVSEEDGILLINPGSLRFPAGRGGSYCYIVVSDGKIRPVLVGEEGY